MTQSVHSNCIRIFKQPHWLGLLLLLLVSTGHAHGGISSIGGLFYIYLAVMVLGAITTLWLGFFIWLLCNLSSEPEKGSSPPAERGWWVGSLLKVSLPLLIVR